MNKNNIFKPLNSSYRHISLFTYEDTLFVWSNISHTIYVFEGAYIALFLLMEESQDLKLQYNPEISAVVKSINQLLNKNESSSKSYEVLDYYRVKELSSLHMTTQIGQFHKLGKINFSLSCDAELHSLIYPAFSFLELNATPYKLHYHFHITYENAQYSIYVNNMQKDTINKKENLLASLVDVIRITFYQNIDYIVALHAASLDYNGTTFIFPGVSGAGKSTLSTFLTHHGFQLYSDEITVIDDQFKILPLYLPTTIKEGSWSVVENFVPNLTILPIHLRFDEQKIKFITPPLTPSTSSSALNAVMIFPKYKANTTTQLTPIAFTEAIARIKDATYQLHNPEMLHYVKSFMRVLLSYKFYTLNYSDLNDALTTIQKLSKTDE